MRAWLKLPPKPARRDASRHGGPDGSAASCPKTPSLYSDAIASELRKRFDAEVPEAMITVFGPPPVRGVGRAGGFKMMIEDRGDNGPVDAPGGRPRQLNRRCLQAARRRGRRGLRRRWSA